MPSIDAYAEQHYSPYDPQFADVEAEERATMNEAIDEVISTLMIAVNEFEAVKSNFTTRKFNSFILALNEMISDLEGVKEDE